MHPQMAQEVECTDHGVHQHTNTPDIHPLNTMEAAQQWGIRDLAVNLISDFPTTITMWTVLPNSEFQGMRCNRIPKQ